VRDPKAWMWSSARWRDDYERLPGEEEAGAPPGSAG